VVRSLGAIGIPVFSGETGGRSISSSSKYCSGAFSYTSPYVDTSGFIEDVIRVVRGGGATSVLLPMTDVTLEEILKNRHRFGSGVRIPFSSHPRYTQVSDKCSLFRLARRLSVPIPRTVFPSDLDGVEEIVARAGALGYPVVLKPARSRYREGSGWRKASVRYAHDAGELRILMRQEPFLSFPYLLQERVEGPGIGVFLLMRNGEVLARFAHRRIREKPPSGGVSVLCESIDPPHDAMASAVRLLRELEWNGVAMVEFKEDRRDGRCLLMEINARFWGSLQLAVSAGVDFPYLLYKTALGEPVTAPPVYRYGLKSRWELGDLDHLLLRARKTPSALNLPPGAPTLGKVALEFLADFVRPSVRCEVFRPSDPAPFLHEVRDYFRNAFA
jgi:predicted ATP-grasp superfamily ATP-dependent carboligase